MQTSRETTPAGALTYRGAGWSRSGSTTALLAPDGPVVAHMLGTKYSPRQRAWADVAKRAFDLIAALAGLVLVAPTMVVIAILISLDSPGSPFFIQERVGRDGRRFRLWKFRTMVRDAEQRLPCVAHLNRAEAPLFKLPDDPRVTRVGRVLRRLSLDELPQLWNIVRGDMSLVGPRPALASEMSSWPTELFDRLGVRPGLTGLWQVSGRSDASFEDYARLDLHYVNNRTFWVDLAIVGRTLPAVLRRRGAY